LATSEVNFYLWNANVPVNEELSELSVLQYNVQHDGVYIDANVLNANFVATPIELCEQEETQFTDQSTGTIVSWEWTFIGGYPDSSVEPNPIIWYGTAGEYDVTLTVSDGANSHTTTKTNYISVVSEAVVPDQPNGPIVVETSQNLFTYYETSSPNADEYIWELIPDDMGLIVPGDTLNEVKIYWSQSNSYQVQLSARAINACGESELSEPLVIYVNWNTDVFNHEEANSFDIFPNPNLGTLYLDLKSSFGEYDFTVLNLMGKILLNESFTSPNNNIHKVELTHLPAGIYICTIQTQNKIQSLKLVKY
jgi:PKD repeat protein